MKWLGFIGIVISVLWSVRKSGRDAEKAVNAQAETERERAQTNAIKRDFEIINENATLTRTDTTNSLRSGEF